MKRVCVVLLAVFMVLAAFSAYAAQWKEVDAGKLKEMMETEDVLVVYPLSRIEYNDLHIKGSVNIPMQRLHKELPGDEKKQIVFYCLGPR